MPLLSPSLRRETRPIVATTEVSPSCQQQAKCWSVYWPIGYCPLLDHTLPESQFGFCPSRGTSDIIFTACQLQEKCWEQHLSLCMLFIDLTKAFDSMNRTALWCILAKMKSPDKNLKILRLLHDDMMATVVGKGGLETSPSE